MSVSWQGASGTRRLLTLALALPIAVLLIVVSSLAARPEPAAAATVTIPMGGNVYYWFCDSSHIFGNVCTTTIQAGDTVTWQNVSDTAHTSTECDGNCGAALPPSPLPLWDSGLVAPSGTFSRQFNQAGTFDYQCNVHPTQMRGQIIVLGPATVTPTAAPTSTPTPAPAVGGVSLDPTQVPPGGSVGYGAALLAALVAGAITTIGGAAWWLSKRAVGRR
jgi:plastocyanin